MTDDSARSIPQLDAALEALADEIAAWAAGLGIELTYADPVLEESGRNAWADGLGERTGRALRTAGTLLTAGDRIGLAEDLRRRMEELQSAAEAYEQRLEALEDQRRVHVEGIVARYRRAFGQQDPDNARLWRLCQGIHRVWTFRSDESELDRPEAFAEAIDRAWLEEDGAKRRALAETRKRAVEIVEHLRLLAAGLGPERPREAAAGEKVSSKRGKRGPARMSLKEAWRYLSVVQEWTGIQQDNRKKPMRDRVRKIQVAERHGITVGELNAMLAWYAKHQREGRFPEDPRTLSRGELQQWFE